MKKREKVNYWKIFTFVLAVFIILYAGLKVGNEKDVRESPASGVSHAWGEITEVPAGFADGVDNGIASESDPTVPASVKDGISWGEISGKPAVSGKPKLSFCSVSGSNSKGCGVHDACFVTSHQETQSRSHCYVSGSMGGSWTVYSYQGGCEVGCLDWS